MNPAASISRTAYLRELLDCRALTVAGNGRVDGAAAIRLATTRRTGQFPDTAVLWVSRTGYLPLRLALQPLPGERRTSAHLRIFLYSAQHKRGAPRFI